MKTISERLWELSNCDRVIQWEHAFGISATYLNKFSTRKPQWSGLQ